MERRQWLMAAPLLLAGCATGRMGGADMAALTGLSGRASSNGSMAGTKMPDMDAIVAQSRFMQDVMASPDLPAWHAQRERMALAVGDRTFDRSFDRVFDSMIIALATLGSRVNNMERVSGYITATIPDLGPTRTEALQKDGLRQYAVAKGYPPGIVDRKGDGFEADVSGTAGMMTRGMAGLTLSLTRLGPKQTRVKLRFDNVYYPELVNEYYKLVWAAVDKQMFLDTALD